MPVLSTVGGASLRAFGAFRATSASPFIVATGGTVYVDPTDADFKIHEFTTSDTFAITTSPLLSTIQLMMIGGGGGGGSGGGGAGGYIYRPSFSIGVGSYSVVVGSGGVFSFNGGNTTFSGLIALGGGGTNSQGGSGGGAIGQSGGAGLQPTSASGGFGNKGGDWGYSEGNDGGGGGAGTAGSIPAGGAGRVADIINSSGTAQVLAQGGYGNQDSTSFALPAVLANSGNGGWGGGYSGISFQDGQAGIVRIRYKFQ